MTALRIGLVSYLNALPYQWCIESLQKAGQEIVLEKYPPSLLASYYEAGAFDCCLLPVAALEPQELRAAHRIQCFGIACDGKVGSVCLFSNVPLALIRRVYVDGESRTSNMLMRVLDVHFIKNGMEFLSAPCLSQGHSASDAFIAIGDKAFTIKTRYVYDLGELWKEYTGLPFVFAVWAVHRDCDVQRLDGLAASMDAMVKHIDKEIASRHFITEQQREYLLHNIKYNISDEMKKGISLFHTLRLALVG